MSDYREWIMYEKQLYIDQVGGKKQFILRKIKSHPDYFAWKYVKLLRKTRYHYEKRHDGIISMILYLWTCRRKNVLGRKLGIEMGEKCAGRGLLIYHTQGIVINGNVRIGENCRLHGNNCIGNDGKSKAAPRIGNNVDIGVGAKIIGDIEIADDIIIGAGAVVVDTCLQKGAVLVGVPAKPIK